MKISYKFLFLGAALLLLAALIFHVGGQHERDSENQNRHANDAELAQQNPKTAANEKLHEALSDGAARSAFVTRNQSNDLIKGFDIQRASQGAQASDSPPTAAANLEKIKSPRIKLEVAYLTKEQMKAMHPEATDEELSKMYEKQSQVPIIRTNPDEPRIPFSALTTNCPVLQTIEVPVYIKLQQDGKVATATPIVPDYNIPQALYECRFSSPELTGPATTLFMPTTTEN